MKKLILLVALIFLVAAACKEKKPVEFTRLGYYTPYQSYMENLKGKVKSVSETNYWAIPEGETYNKGAAITAAELDSLTYTGNFVATFDESGDIVSCKWLDENDKILSKWEISKENNLMSRADYMENDTARAYHDLRCDAEGNIIEIEVYNAPTDTMTSRVVIDRSLKGDTVFFRQFRYNGEPGNTTMDQYDINGNYLGYKSYDREGNYRSGSELTYHEDGTISGIRFFDKDGNIVAENEFSTRLDEMGNPQTTLCKDKKGFAIFTERVYTYFE